MFYCTEREEDPYSLNIRVILKFMHYATHKLKMAFCFIKWVRKFVIETRQLAGKPLSQNELTYLSKFLRASFNEKPPIPKSKPFAWDINIVLDYLVKMGSNLDLPYIRLAGKTVLLILLSSMCRLTEVRQFKLSQMAFGLNGITVKLLKPTKTVNFRNAHFRQDLQSLEIQKFPGNALLCPVTAIQDYINITANCRGLVDELFVLYNRPSKPAAPYTVARWAKRIMIEAGVGGFGVSSVRSSSASCSVLSGVQLDQLVGLVGWSSASTFVNSYLKPVLSVNNASLPSPTKSDWTKKTGTRGTLGGQQSSPTGQFKVPPVPGAKKVHSTPDKSSTGKTGIGFKDQHNFSKLWKSAQINRGRHSSIESKSTKRVEAYIKSTATMGLKKMPSSVPRYRTHNVSATGSRAPRAMMAWLNDRGAEIKMQTKTASATPLSGEGKLDEQLKPLTELSQPDISDFTLQSVTINDCEAVLQKSEKLYDDEDEEADIECSQGNVLVKTASRQQSVIKPNTIIQTDNLAPKAGREEHIVKIKSNIQVVKSATSAGSKGPVVNLAPNIQVQKVGSHLGYKIASKIPRPSSQKGTKVTLGASTSASQILRARGVLAKSLAQDTQVTAGHNIAKRRPRKEKLNILKVDTSDELSFEAAMESQVPVSNQGPECDIDKMIFDLDEGDPLCKREYKMGTTLGGRAGRNSFIMQHWYPPQGGRQVLDNIQGVPTTAGKMISAQAPPGGPQTADAKAAKCGILNINSGTWTDLSGFSRPRKPNITKSLVGVKFERFLRKMDGDDVDFNSTSTDK